MPGASGAAGSSTGPALLKLLKTVLLPLLHTSKNSRRFPRPGSAGISNAKCDEKRTRPSESVGASPMSVMLELTRASGSTAKCAVPFSSR